MVLIEKYFVWLQEKVKFLKVFSGKLVLMQWLSHIYILVETLDFAMDRQLKLTPKKNSMQGFFLLTQDLQQITSTYVLPNMLLKINVTSNISIAVHKGNQKTQDGKILDALMFTKPDNLKQILKSDIGSFPSTSPRDPSIWECTMNYLYAMIRQIRNPTFFLTFSAGKTRWDDVVSTLFTISLDSRNILDLEWGINVS